jgi:hypothetical protein
MWPPGDPVLSDHGLQRNLGADHYATSLRDCVNICASLARQSDKAA